MGDIITNPFIARTQNLGAPLILYLGDGFAVFGCLNSPEGQIQAGKRSLAISQNQGVFWKGTDYDLNTGWQQLLYTTVPGVVTGTGLQAQIPLIQENNFASTSNVTGGEDNISTFTVPANTLTVDGDIIKFLIGGKTANNANNKIIRGRFPTGVINFTTGGIPATDKDWWLEVAIIRTGATSGRWLSDFQYQDTTFTGAANEDPTGIDWATSMQFRVTGESLAAASGDITANFRSVVVYKNPV